MTMGEEFAPAWRVELLPKRKKNLLLSPG